MPVRPARSADAADAPEDGQHRRPRRLIPLPRRVPQASPKPCHTRRHPKFHKRQSFTPLWEPLRPSHRLSPRECTTMRRPRPPGHSATTAGSLPQHRAADYTGHQPRRTPQAENLGLFATPQEVQEQQPLAPREQQPLTSRPTTPSRSRDSVGSQPRRCRGSSVITHGLGPPPPANGPSRFGGCRQGVYSRARLSHSSGLVPNSGASGSHSATIPTSLPTYTDDHDHRQRTNLSLNTALHLTSPYWDNDLHCQLASPLVSNNRAGDSQPVTTGHAHGTLPPPADPHPPPTVATLWPPKPCLLPHCNAAASTTMAELDTLLPDYTPSTDLRALARHSSLRHA